MGWFRPRATSPRAFKVASEPGCDIMVDEWENRDRCEIADIFFSLSFSLQFNRLVMSIYLLSSAVALTVNLAAPDGASNLTHLMHPSAQRPQRGENKLRKSGSDELLRPSPFIYFFSEPVMFSHFFHRLDVSRQHQTRGCLPRRLTKLLPKPADRKANSKTSQIKRLAGLPCLFSSYRQR